MPSDPDGDGRKRPRDADDPKSVPAFPASSPPTNPMTGFERSPEYIGPYRILETIGEGGMGVVYHAEQEHPIRRSVALKVIKLGMDTKEVIARFEAERQASALMSHPHIAKVFEAGATDQGRPYFVMEYVQGEPITAYCDRMCLSMRERLALFVPVCEAIHHAHQKAVIHRDIKPSNVLVGVQDGKPFPKVIDFGVAKATGQRLTERTMFTEQGQLIGTPEYMSPEQAEMTGTNVDTTTDVYSLGVVLYELLTGVLPFDPTELRQAGWDTMHKTIREVEPPRPSTRISQLGEKATDIARRRGTVASRLSGQVKGELDWVTMRAMEKDRTQRYPSASELASDIKRFLRNEPVVARPHSAAYHLRKLVDRHRVPAAFLATTVLLLIGFGVWMSVLYARAGVAERRTALEAQTATQVSDFMVGLFAVSDPSRALGDTLTARQVLDNGVAKIEGELTDQPEIQARLMDTMGTVYRSLGLIEPAQALLEGAVDTRRRVLGDHHPELATSLNSLGLLLMRKTEFAEAQSRIEEALAIRRSSLGDDHLEVASSLNDLGELYIRKGDYPAAEPLLREALAIRRERLDQTHPDVATTLLTLGFFHLRQAEYAEAEPFYREALAIRRSLFGDKHPAVATTMIHLADVLRGRQEFARAEPMIREALVMRREFLGEKHPNVVSTQTQLGEVLSDLGRYEEAEPQFREALATQVELLGEEHLDVATTLIGLANLLWARGDLTGAESSFRDAMAIMIGILGPEHQHVAGIKYHLAGFFAAQDKHDQAIAFLRQAVEHGHVNADWIDSNDDFAPLRDRSGYDEVIGAARERYRGD